MHCLAWAAAELSRSARLALVQVSFTRDKYDTVHVSLHQAPDMTMRMKWDWKGVDSVVLIIEPFVAAICA
jgi:hypothetical protein